MVVANLPYTYVVKGCYWRFRRAGVNVALPGKPGDAEFHRRYGEMMELTAKKEAAAPAESSVAALVAAYRASSEFRLLRTPTQTDYNRTLDIIIAELGDEPYRLVTGKMVKAVRDDLDATPRKAHKVKQMVSRLYSWGQEDGRVKKGHNPAAEFKALKVRAETIEPWSDREIALFLAEGPLFLRLPIMLMLYTGQRGEDVAMMQWTAYQGDYIRVRQSKTGESMSIACHPRLREVLDAVSIRKGRICRNAVGQPYTANAMRKAIGDAVEAIEAMPHRTPHGLRYAAAGMMEEVGCTVGEITAVLGHRTYQMAMKYLLARRQSAAAMAKVS
jgi:integrase